jgi:hypothetical protein
MFSDNGSASNYLSEMSAGSFLHTGVGYWLIRKGSLNIPTYRMTMPQLDSTAMYSIPLHSGWNIIGVPFDEPIPWQAVVAANGLTANTAVFGFNASYAQSQTLQPFTGYYYFNAPNAASLHIPYPFGISTSPGVRPQTEWQAQIVFSSDINTDDGNYIGIGSTMKAGTEATFNQHKPPFFQDLGLLYFDHPEWDNTFSRFTTDIRPSLGDGQVWNFEVSNPRKSKSKLEFKGIENIPASAEVVLVNVNNSSPVDLRKSSTYSYQTVSPKMQFKLLVGSKEFVRKQIATMLPSTFGLEQNYPNPFNLSTSISIRLPQSDHVRLDIYSVLGQHVKTLVDDQLSAGIHTYLWDARDAAGEVVASGVYFYRLSNGTNTVLSKKMILLK